MKMFSHSLQTVCAYSFQFLVLGFDLAVSCLARFAVVFSYLVTLDSLLAAFQFSPLDNSIFASAPRDFPQVGQSWSEPPRVLTFQFSVSLLEHLALFFKVV
jgi:hypothetical protein